MGVEKASPLIEKAENESRFRTVFNGQKSPAQFDVGLFNGFEFRGIRRMLLGLVLDRMFVAGRAAAEFVGESTIDRMILPMPVTTNNQHVVLALDEGSNFVTFIRKWLVRMVIRFL